jgi:RNA polymerase sigma factor (sigma-70 family)
MASLAPSSLARQLGSLFAGGSAAGLSDRELLERFTGRGGPADEAAFATIVARHGPMVLGLCRQLLGDQHHAEDAFQATFLVLACRARSIRDPDVLGPWLYGVALRTARKARARLARRRQAEEAGAIARTEASPAVQAEQMIERERAEALHHEVDRLPEPFRRAVVACYFEGLSPDEAARRLRWSSGTLRSRLVRARDKLRRGLARRGIVLSTTALGVALAPRSASASVSSLLCDSTTRTAIHFAARRAAGEAISASAAALAQEVLKTMIVHKLKAAALSFLMLATLAAGAGYLSLNAFAGPREGEPPGEPGAKEARQEPRPPAAGDATRPAPGRMFVEGRVLDPDGKPVANATAMAYAALKWPGRGDRLAPTWPSPLGRARSDGSGRFRLDAPRVSSSRHYEFGAVAIAPGYGAGWVELDPDADRPDAVITLRPEQVIHGRVFDVQGRPVRDIEVSVESLALPAVNDPTRPEGEEKGPYFLRDQPHGPPAWPRPATTDADGRFTIRGVGRGLRARLAIDDPRFARLNLAIDTDASSAIKSLTMAVEPARIITGRVTYADTGEPAPHARVEVEFQRDGGSAWAGDFETDAQGRFRANPRVGPHYSVMVFAPESTPYLTASKRFAWPKGALEQTVDLALPRGVLVRGKVIEEGSGKPIAGARINYLSHPDRDPRTGATNGRAMTAEDGTFQLGVVPGPGYLAVLGPGEDYVLHEIGRRMTREGRPSGQRQYAHAFHRLELEPDDDSRDVTIALWPSTPVPIRVVGPDDRPAQDAAVISRVILQPTWIAWFWWRSYYHGAVRDGHFTVHGLADDAEVPVSFLDARHNLGATARLSGRSGANGPVTVRLEPFGAARARLVDLAGKPAPRSRDGSTITTLVVTPGPSLESEDRADQDRLAADEAVLARFDPIHHEKPPGSDDRGQLTVPSLIPGATYRIYDGTAGAPGSSSLRKEFTVRSGETVDLGDIRIERP